ncbi:LuxR C-terminal-related transcriptional regulator [Microbacterium sp. ZW CA_36]|uniref:helix-turn-helix transcriptional regulator n=1 Tax=Microbacterium sp. ZW CA_36 TaxID=3378078 RepID=UPI003853BB64
MSESSLEAPSSVRSLSSHLLSTKTSIRPRRAGAVSRRDVIDRARESGASVVAVTAPAGYGKSTMLAEWAAVESRPVAWATVDDFDDDPVALLTLLATAGGQISPRAREVSEAMGAMGVGVLGRSAPMLAEALAQAPAPFVLFVDDVHAASSDACHDALELVLAGIPAGSQIVLASRREQPYLARLRADGAMFELGSDDLRIDEEGARRIFKGASVTVSDEALAVAVDRCEGWATGLYLCALATRAGSDVVAITGGERFVADYLYGEGLAGLSDELRDFLRRTAVLDQMSGRLCDAMLQTDDSHALLRDLEARGVFLVALDGERRWFRYHALFREFLLTELSRVEASRIVGLHLRAAEWFEQAGLPERAIEHLLAAGERTRAGVLVAQLAMPAYQSGRIAVLDRWLAALGPATIEASSGLMGIAAWTALLAGQSPAAEERAGTLERARLDFATADEALAFESSRAMIRIAMCLSGPSRLLTDAELAVASEPLWSPWRAPALYLLGTALVLVGDTPGAERAFTASVERAAQAGNTAAHLLSESELAVIALDGGTIEDAAHHARAAMSVVDDNHLDGYPTATLALAVSARVALRRGDAAASHRLLARAMRARIHCNHVMPFVAVRARLQLAKVFAGLGDAAAARQLLKEADDLLQRCPQVAALGAEVTEFRQSLGDGSGTVLGLPLTPAEMRLLPYLQTHLMIAEIGQRLFISRNTASTEVKSIYRKLGATTRSAAVERAIELGLLGG